MGQVGWAEFPIRACWGFMPSDKVVWSTATPSELICIAIIRDWVTKNSLLVHLEVLLVVDNLNTFLPPIAHFAPSTWGIVICPLLDS